MFNLDSLSIEQLINLYNEVRIHPRISAKKYSLSVRDVKLYGHYAINKATARRARIDGDTNTARIYEDICDRIYERITVKVW